MTGSSFHGLRKKAVCSQVVNLYIMIKLCLEDHILELLVVQIIVIQKSGKFTGNLLAICIRQSVRPGENETPDITASFCFYSKEPGLLLAINEERERKPLD